MLGACIAFSAHTQPVIEMPEFEGSALPANSCIGSRQSWPLCASMCRRGPSSQGVEPGHVRQEKLITVMT